MDARKRPGAGPLPTSREGFSSRKINTPPHATPGRDAPEPARSVPSAEQVFHDYAPRVYSTARRMVANDFDAEDVTQDVLLQVVRKLPSFRGESALPTWLHRITVNAALTHRRRRAVREERRVRNDVEHLLENDAGTRPRPLAPPDELIVVRETRQLIERAIAALPAAYRSVFVLADVEGLPNAAIAARLGLSLPAVKSRLHRARLLLRDALAAHFRPHAG
jgi:RNA polymerase sigma-70 factor (ECF subfamily)